MTEDELRDVLKAKVANAELILSDNDTFLWFRQEGHIERLKQEGEIPPPGGGNWLALLGALSVVSLLGKVSYLADERIDDVSITDITHRRTRKMSLVGVSEIEGQINLLTMSSNSPIEWGVNGMELRVLWEDNRDWLAHLAFPRHGAGVTGKTYGYLSAKTAIHEGRAGKVCEQLPLSNSPFFFNADILTAKIRELIPKIITIIDTANAERLNKINEWCSIH